MLSLNVESARQRHASNFSLVEDGKLGVLRSAAILGANASGKSNLLTSIMALRWLVVSSGGRREGEAILPYEPFRLSADGLTQPVNFEIEFIVPSGVRYRYEISFSKNRVLRERLYSFARKIRALIFERSEEDTWENVKFGGTYKGGTRKFSFFPNAAYLSRAGNDPSSPEFIREIYRYFRNIRHVSAGNNFTSLKALKSPAMLSAVSDLICLADTGVSKLTIEENKSAADLKLPDDMPEEVKSAIIAHNILSAKYWMKSQSGELVSFDDDEISDGTTRLQNILPTIINAFHTGGCITFDEMDAHFHTDIVELILRLFNDEDINSKGAQIIFTTHDTNILNSNLMRRDQIWFVSKVDGSSSLRSLDEYDRNFVRHDSPFESFYRDGRLGALPKISFGRIKNVIIEALAHSLVEGSELDA